MKKEKMIWRGVSKNTYTAPEMSVYEFSADTGIMQMSSNTIPPLSEEDLTGIWA